MVDLHNHILPGIDDGAETAEESLALLQMQQKDGVTHVALTPHFNFERRTIRDFVAERDGIYESFKPLARQSFPDITFKIGAEVFFSPKLLEEDVRPLCYEGTDYLLVEFPLTYYPKWTTDVFYHLQLAGIVPVIAHVERYPFVLKDLSILYDWVRAGAVAHVNATSVAKHKKRRKAIDLMIKHDLIHFVATDAHSVEKRPPCLAEAYAYIASKFGESQVRHMVQNSLDVFENMTLDAAEPSEVRQILGFVF